MNQTLSKAIFEKETKELNGRVAQVRGWKVHELNYPIVDITFIRAGRKSFRVRMKCQDYDEQPPSIEFLTDDGNHLMAIPTGTNVINPGLHETTKRPFVCSPGSLEYHTHSGHISDKWDNYRGTANYDLGGILTQIYHAWFKTTDPA